MSPKGMSTLHGEHSRFGRSHRLVEWSFDVRRNPARNVAIRTRIELLPPVPAYQPLALPFDGSVLITRLIVATAIEAAHLDHAAGRRDVEFVGAPGDVPLDANRILGDVLFDEH